ncbi:MAG: DNA-3-methyladenine glycosylase family protein [Actinomycetota bacterium]
MPARTVRSPTPIDLRLTLGRLAHGRGDPTTRIGRGEVCRALRSPDGPAAVRFAAAGDLVEVEAWGVGAAWALERAHAWCGVLDDVADFDPAPGLVRHLWRRHPGLRMPRTELVTEHLIPVICEQKVTGAEARRAYRRLTLALGERAPGPLGLMLPPDPERVATMPYYGFHPFGIEQRRATTIRQACRRASWLDAAAHLPLEVAKARIGALPGVGPWSVAEVSRVALGDADAVSVGDFHVPNLVAWVLAGEPRGTDERMLELLEPFRPHRGRVQLLIETGHVRPPAYGPRMAQRSIARS